MYNWLSNKGLKICDEISIGNSFVNWKFLSNYSPLTSSIYILFMTFYNVYGYLYLSVYWNFNKLIVI